MPVLIPPLVCINLISKFLLLILTNGVLRTCLMFTTESHAKLHLGGFDQDDYFLTIPIGHSLPKSVESNVI